MAVMRVHKNGNYTIMSNYHFKEKEMSLKAKGLLSLMLSLPDDWDYSISGLATLSKDGRDSVMGALQELERFGYLIRTRVNNSKGHFAGYDYDIYEEPQSGKPDTEKPNTVEPSTENPEQLNTNPLTTKENKVFKNKLINNNSAPAPNKYTSILIKNFYLDENEAFMDQYNYLLDELVKKHGEDLIHRCLTYFLQCWTGYDENGKPILNKFGYFKTSIENSLQRLTNEPKPYNWLNVPDNTPF